MVITHNVSSIVWMEQSEFMKVYDSGIIRPDRP